MIKEKGRSAAAANVIELYPLGMQKEIAPEQRKETWLFLSLCWVHTQAEQATQGPERERYR